MKLNHINLSVTDVSAAQVFLEKYFGLKCKTTRGNSFALMFDDDGLVLTLMKEPQVAYPKTFHIGFIQTSEEKVNEINQRLKDDGFDIKPPQKIHGSWTFYMEAPGGFTVEILA